MKKKKPVPNINPESVLALLGGHRKPLRSTALAEMLALPHAAKKQVESILHQLQKDHAIQRLPGGFWTLPDRSQCVIGKFMALPSGGGRVRVSEPANYPHKEIFISPFQTAGAWHNDIVRVNILAASGGGKGKILEIIERPTKEVPVILKKRNHHSLLFKAADGRLAHQFIVRPENIAAIDIRVGDLANIQPIRKLEGDNRRGELWEAKLLGVFGPADRIKGQEAIVKIAQNVPGAFPPLAVAQAEALPPAPHAQEMKGREDQRHIAYVTIDGADARDFDDAIHVEKTPSGWLLRVAIADVSHYVHPDETPGSLDAEARNRGNSWYFPRSVEPMLPKALSNGLCSLRPDEDRLAMLAEIAFSPKGEVQSCRFAPIVMRSAGRLIYDDVADFLAGNTRANLPDAFRPMLMDAYELYKVLWHKRRKQGTLDFCLPEPLYKFDQDGRLTHMGMAERNDANMLIEEFMIAANEAVAEFLQKQNIPLLYRDHPEPQRDKLVFLYNTLKKTALETLPPDLEKNGEPNPFAIQKILHAAAGTPKEYIVNRLCLRSMAQARYQPENLGHFGLASKAYCHFTSPIRRYADLLVHRALKFALKLNAGPIPDKEQLAEIADQLNGLERRAIDCERDMAKRLACIALEGSVGDIISGTISGVTDFGLFVEFKELPAEGLMRLEELGDDWWQVDESTQSVIGQRSGNRWQLGQPVTVRILSIDLEKQEIRLAPDNLPQKKRKTKPSQNRKKQPKTFAKAEKKPRARKARKG